MAISASTRGRTDGDSVLATVPNDSAYAEPLAAPCTNRPTTSTAIDGASAETSNPTK